MWRCARCGTRNDRSAGHCQRCGMASPFHGGGHTQPVELAAVEAEETHERRSPPWAAIVVIVALVVVLVAIGVIAVTA